MEFTIKQKDLNEALSAVRGSLEPKATIPVLSNFLFETIGENAIRITGTDLDLYIRKTAEANIVVPGLALIPAKKICEVINSLAAGDCYFRTEKNGWMLMKSGKSTYKFASVPTENFPEIPTTKSTPIKLPTEVLRDLVDHTSFIPEISHRFALDGGKLEIGGGQIEMAATNQHRISYVRRDVDVNGHKLDVIVPRKAMIEMQKIKSENVAIGEDDQKRLFIESDDQMIIARTIAGTFPNYQMVFPKEHENTATIVIGDLVSAVKRAAFMADATNKSIGLTVSKGEIKITAARSELGDGEERIDAEYDGDEITISFQWIYLTDYLSTLPADKKILFHFKDSKSAVEINLEGEDKYRYIVMPLQR